LYYREERIAPLPLHIVYSSSVPSVKDAGISWGLDEISLNFFSTIVKAKEQTQHQFFMELFSIAARELWKQRNGKIFRKTTATMKLENLRQYC
jgi:hypothetical protein